MIARRWGAGHLAAALGAALILLAPVHVTYSTNVKQFTLDLVLGLALLHTSWLTFDAPDQDRLRRLALAAAVAIVFSPRSDPSRRLRSPRPPSLASRSVSGGSRSGRAYTPCTRPSGRWSCARGWPPSLDDYWQQATSSGIADPFDRVGRLASELAGGPWLGGAMLVALATAAVVLPWRERLLLIGPILVAALASFVGIPLGTGRTDLYLYGGVAIAVALVVDRVVSVAWLKAATLAGLVAARITPLPHPGYADPGAGMQEDSRPLVHLAAERLGPDDQLITVGARFPVALYGPWPVAIHDAPKSTTGWLPVIQDDRILTISTWADTPAEIRDTFPEATADRVQVLVSHFDHTVAVAAFQTMVEAGYVQTEQHTRDGAWWAKFQRQRR